MASSINSRGGRPPASGGRGRAGGGGARATSIAPVIFSSPPEIAQPVTPIAQPVTPISQPEPVRGPTKRQVVRVLSNVDGVLTFDGGMQIVAGDQPYDPGDRILLVNGQPSGRMQPVDEIEEVYIL